MSAHRDPRTLADARARAKLKEEARLMREESARRALRLDPDLTNALISQRTGVSQNRVSELRKQMGAPPSPRTSL